MRRLFPTVLLLFVSLLNGCGRGDRPLLAPVSGTVTYNGQPLARGRIVFFPDKGRPASGKILDGKILEVSTFDQGDGAMVGHHKIQIASFVREPRGMEIVPWAIPEHYGKAATSDLTAEIIAGKPNELRLELH